MKTQTERRREKTIELCRELGIRIIQIGQAYHLEGPGVSCVTPDLANITPRNLVPQWRRRYA